MAMKKAKKNPQWGAVRGVGTAFVPIAGQMSSYRGGRDFAKSKGATKGVARVVGVGTAAAGFTVIGTPGNVAASGYRGYHKAEAKNAKRGVRSVRPTPTRTKGRVQKKGY